MSSDVRDTVLEYFPTKTSWYQDQESERKKFEDMIQCASHITEAIDARVNYPPPLGGGLQTSTNKT